MKKIVINVATDVEIFARTEDESCGSLRPPYYLKVRVVVTKVTVGETTPSGTLAGTR